MKKVFLIFILISALVFQGVAQDNAKRIEKWIKELGLSADQATQIKAAFAERKTKVDAAKTNPQGKDKAAIKAAKEEFRTKLNTILTPEQQAKLKAMRKENKGKRKGKNKDKKDDDGDDDDLD
jgi:Spy/CpxP family protein refolding chaperone